MTPQTKIALLGCLVVGWTACRDFGSSSVGGTGGRPPTAAGAAGIAESGQNAGGSGKAFGGLSGHGGEHEGGGGADGGMGDGGNAGRRSAGGVSGGAGAVNSGGEADVAGDGSDQSSPARLSPSQIDGLTLWLEASEELCRRDANDQVESCSDQSSHANDAVQLDSQRRPTFVAKGSNGRPTLRFDDDPSALIVADNASLRFGTGDFAYLAVASWHNEEFEIDGYAGYGLVVAKQYKVSPYDGVVLYANFPSDGGPGSLPSMRRFAAQIEVVENVAISATNHVNDDTFRLYSARRVGGELQIYINGSLEGRTVIDGDGNVDAVGEDLVIGGYPGSPLRGEISEVVVIGGPLSDDDFAALQRGLLEKYAL